MSSAEEEDLKARISLLEGRINRRKAQQDSHHSPRPYRAAPYHRGTPSVYRGGRGGRGGRGHAPTYRNRTLVLNGNGNGNANGNGTDSSDGSWVSKTDRHLQLINTSVFEKDSQARASAIEQTQRQKRLQREHMEKSRVLNFVQQHGSSSVPSNTTPAASKYEISVEGIRFQVTKQGSKLVRVDNNNSSATPRIASVGAVKFYRTKNGNLIRHGVAKAQRLAGGIKKVDVPCKTFSWTGIVFSNNVYGIASLPFAGCGGPRCRYQHDPSKVAICRDWLFKNDCPNGDSCDLSHEITEERTPLCMHFANGKCNNDSCPYTHAEHSPADLVCRVFGLYGFCDKGAKCPDRHVFECPDFSNTGVCKTPGCKLLHRERASVLRKAGPAKEKDQMDDLSSDDDEDAGASDDLDSDEVDEFIGADADDLDFSKDFIGF